MTLCGSISVCICPVSRMAWLLHEQSRPTGSHMRLEYDIVLWSCAVGLNKQSFSDVVTIPPQEDAF
eukprot:3022525-Amphidinium_carterae.1